MLDLMIKLLSLQTGNEKHSSEAKLKSGDSLNAYILF